MALIEGEGIYGMDQGCDLHGDDRMRECSMCGIEFCALCCPNSVMCPGCASESVEDEIEDEADFEDAHDVDELLEYDNMVPPAAEARTKSDESDG